jgi:hypothetical protein
MNTKPGRGAKSNTVPYVINRAKDWAFNRCRMNAAKAAVSPIARARM